MKVKILVFFSFIFASATLVQHEVKLPSLNKVEGLENSCNVVSCILWRTLFLRRHLTAAISI